MRLRVIVVGPSPALLGGISSLARTLVERLSREPEFLVEFVPMDPEFPLLLRPLQRIRYVRTVVRFLIYCALLPARIRRASVVHVYSASSVAFLLASTPALLIARAFRKPVILNYHSGDAEEHLDRWRSAVPTMRLADAIVVSSGFLEEVLARSGLRAHVLPSPIDLDAFAFGPRARLRPRFFTSRLHEPIYNVPCVLHAFRIIQEHYPDAVLAIAGEGRQRPRLEALVRQLGLRNVSFVGRIPSHELPDYCSRFDVYLSGTDVDNVPSSLIEAMAAGMPVVTTDAGGIPYIFRHGATCMMVPRGDPARMAAEALRLLGDPQLAGAIARQARLRCTAFEWAQVRTRWLALYERLASGGERGCAAAREQAKSPQLSA